MAVDETQPNITNKAIQIIEHAVDDTCILVGKRFSVTNGILAKGILINQRGQKELGMTVKNHEPKPLSFQVVDNDRNEQEELRKDLEEESTTTNFHQVAREGDISPRSVDKTKSAGKQAKKYKDKTIPVRVQSKKSRLSIFK